MRYVVNVPRDWSRQNIIDSMSIPEDLEPDDRAEILALIDEAEKIASPKFVYKISAITGRDAAGLWFDGVRIDSELAAENLRNTDVVYPYVCTCGRELYDWSRKITDPLLNYYADKLMNFYLARASACFLRLIREKYITKDFAVHMNPGSLPQWSISQQANLFLLIGDVEKDVGVHLTDSFLMLPEKSGSGFYFHSDNDYSNCDSCPNYDCPHRRTTK